MIPVSEPSLGDKELQYVAQCVRSGWVSSVGGFVSEFEQRWAEYCGRRYGIAVSSGTAALQLSVACLGLRPGDEVVMPTFTIISCALAVIYNGGTPVLVDSDPLTGCMDVNQLEAKISNRTRAIMPVHIYGHPVDMDAVTGLAARHGLAIIEDSAEAHGAQYLSGRDRKHTTWHRCGGFGDLSCFSFYANKIITTGEGGMVLTDDAQLAEKARSLRDLCFQPARRFYHEEMGFNFRLGNLQAALGLAQLERIENIIARKQWIGREYNRCFEGASGLQLFREASWARSVYWVYAVTLSDEVDMDAHQFARKLEARGVETRPFFLGMHEQPALQKRGLFVGEHHPVAERLARRGLYLPSGTALTEEQLGQVCDAVRAALA